MHMAIPPAVLVVGPAWVGDMVMAQSLFIILKRRNPHEKIDVVAPAWSLPLLERMPEVRQGIALPVGHRQLGLWARYKTAKALKSNAYRQAIVLPRSMKSAIVPFFAGIPKRTGFLGEYRHGLLNDIRHLDKAVLDQTVKKFIALGLSAAEPLVTCPEPRLRTDEANRQRLLLALRLECDRPVVALMPGAEYGPAKQWPLEYFAELIVQLEQRNIQTWIFGSGKEKLAADTIIAKAGSKGINLCGRTRLQDAVDLIAGVDCVVSNDSGLMHIAAAVDRPLVALYGSSSPLYTPPLSSKAEILYLNLDCSPCFKRQCPLSHLNCLKQITVERVLITVERLLLE